MSIAAAERLHISVFLAQLFLVQLHWLQRAHMRMGDPSAPTPNAQVSPANFLRNTDQQTLSPRHQRYRHGRHSWPSCASERSHTSVELGAAVPRLPTTNERRSAQSRSQCRHELEHVANQPVVGNAEDR